MTATDPRQAPRGSFVDKRAREKTVQEHRRCRTNASPRPGQHPGQRKPKVKKRHSLFRIPANPLRVKKKV